MLRTLLLSLIAVCLAAPALAAPSAPTFSGALTALVVPSPTTVDAVQKALDDGWPADAAKLVECLEQNRAGLEAFRQAVDAGATDFPSAARGARPGLSALRLALGLTLIDAQRAATTGDTAACGRDLQTLGGATRLLLAAPSTRLRIIGLSTVTRAALVARRTGAPLGAVSLPPLAELVAFEKSQFLAAADLASKIDGTLTSHVRSAAARLAVDYYDPLAGPLTSEQADVLITRYEAFSTDLGNRYRAMDPQKLLELLPMPIPPPQKLGEAVAGVVLCGQYLDALLLVRRYRDAERALR